MGHRIYQWASGTVGRHAAAEAVRRSDLELAGLHRRLEAARSELTEAARDRRAIELLRERRLFEWRRRIDRAEDAVIDDLAAAAAARQENH